MLWEGTGTGRDTELIQDKSPIDTLRNQYGKVHEILTSDQPLQPLQPEKTSCSYLCLQIPSFSITVEKKF